MKNEIKKLTNVAICNKAQEDMAKKFGWFVMMFLFWLPKYDDWYQNRKKEIRGSLK